MTYLILFEIATSIGAILSLFTSFYIDEIKHKKRKTMLLIASLILICISSYLSFSNELDASNTHEKERHELIKKLDTNINKSRLLLDSLQEVQKNVLTINDSIKKELNTSKEINSSTKLLLNKNEKILSSEKSIYQNSERALHHLFPLTFTINFEIPFSSMSIKPLVGYLYRLKATLENSDSIPDHIIAYSKKPDFKDIFILAFGYNYIQKTLSFKNVLTGTLEFSFLKAPVKNIENISPSTPQLNFTVGVFDWSEPKPDVHITTYFDDSIIKFHVTYTDYQFRSSEYHQTNADMGSNELPGCLFVVN